MPAPSYIVRDRHGGYLFRITVPQGIRPLLGGQKTIRKSLATHHKSTAIKRARGWAYKLIQLFDSLKMKNDYEFRRRIAIARKKIEKDQLSEEVFKLPLDSIKSLLGDGVPTEELLRLIGAEERTQQIEEFDSTIAEYDALILKAEEIKRLIADEKLTNRVLHDYGMQSNANPSGLAIIQESPPLSTLWEKYRSHKIQNNDWKQETPKQERKVREYDSQFRDFLEIIGGNMPASRFGEEEAAQFVSGLYKFPKNRTKLFPGVALENIPASAETLSTSTISQRLETIRPFFNFLKKKGHVIENHFDDYRVDRDSRSYPTPTNQDLMEWFNLPEELINTAWQFWIPRIAVLTGARQNEVAQLHVKDIHLDVDSKIWCMTISDGEGRSTKSEASNRTIPIPTVLIDNGFLELHKRASQRGHTELWQNLPTKGGVKGGTVSTYWTQLKNKHKILSQPKDRYGKEKVFHSLRRVIINQLYNMGVDLTVIQSIVGHEPSLVGHVVNSVTIASRVLPTPEFARQVSTI